MHASNFVNTTLASKYYLTWETQLINVIESQGFCGFVGGKIVEPPKILSSDLDELNPDYVVWKKVDRTLKGWITGIPSEDASCRGVGTLSD